MPLVTKIFVTSGVHFKSAKYFNIQTYYFKEINVLDERLLMIFCSKSKALCKCYYHQIWACLRRKICHHNLTLLTLYKKKKFRLLSLKCPFDKKLIFLSFFFQNNAATHWNIFLAGLFPSSILSILMSVWPGFMNFMQIGRYKVNADAWSQLCILLVILANEKLDWIIFS